jgi:RecA-family ATPase
MKTLKFSQARELYKTMPPKKMLWSGVVEKSFGLVFGPSKTGKTIFCENLAMSIAVGRESYFDYPLDGVPKKVLFISLEESFRNRLGRNFKQFEALNEEEQTLMGENYDIQELDFPQFIVTKENWESLHLLIENSGAEVVFIDSITRMNHGKLEDGKTAEEIMSRLRIISQDLDVTLFAIHHTPKLYGSPITMDSIKGSAVFAQESDFAIGVNRTDAKHRYIKNVFFRYENDDDEFVKEFAINQDAWLEQSDDVEEVEILRRTDRRRAEDKRDVVKTFFDSNPNVLYSATEAVEVLMPIVGVKERQIKSYLSELSSAKKIKSSERGYYSSVNYKYSEEGGNVA